MALHLFFCFAAGILLCAEDFAGAGYLLGGGGRGIRQAVGDAQVVPLEGAQGVVGQHLYALHIGERVDEAAKLRELLLAGSDAGDEDVANPNGLFYLGEITGAVEDGLVAVACEPAVLLAIDVLDVEQHQVGGLHQALELGEEGRLAGEGLG